MSKRKMLVISNLYPPDARGGAEQICADFVGEFRRLGWDVSVLTSATGRQCHNGGETVCRSLRFHQPPVYTRGKSPLGQLKKLADYRGSYFDRSNASVADRVVAELNPDIVLLSSLYGIGGISIMEAVHQRQMPSVAFLQDYWLLSASKPPADSGRLNAPWLKRALSGFASAEALSRNLNGLVAISRYVKDVHLLAGLLDSRIAVVSHGIPREFIRGHPVTNASRRLLFVGRLVPEKGLHILLEALALANGRLPGRVGLDVIGGNGPAEYGRRVRELAREYGLNDDIAWHGWLERGEIAHFYDNSCALVVPSLWEEPLGVVAMEASSRGRPVIASRRGGLPEMVEHGRNGLLFEAGNPQELALAIERLVEASPDWQGQFASEALAITRERFCLETNAERFSAILEEMAA